ncbi:MAG: methyltransferase domain-containing protein [Thermodesulfobacteriota bacterium]
MVKFRHTLWPVVLLVAVLGLCITGYGQEREPDVIFVPTPEEVVMEMLHTARVTGNDTVYDLGCGDGRIVITAAKLFGARGVGVDIDPFRIKESNENARRIGVADRVNFVEQDLFKTDISEATVVFLYLLTELNLQLRPKLFKELKPGTRIVSHEFDMGDWKPDRTGVVENVKLLYSPNYPTEKDVNFYYWVIPANVAGMWRWELATGTVKQEYTLRLVQKFQEVSGAVTVKGREIPIRDARLVGDELSFSLKESTGKESPVMRFYGHVNGDRIEGLVEVGPYEKIYNWAAKRNP